MWELSAPLQNALILALSLLVALLAAWVALASRRKS
jgi:hypothetical protein